MSYSKTTWKTGDTITAQLLNHAEDGIAANDAAIAALPEGLQLYGPYTAVGSGTVTPAGVENVYCESMEDVNGISVTFPEASADAKTLVLSVRMTELLLQGFEGPLVYMGDLGLEWGAGCVVVYNSDDTTTGSVTCTMTFYSNVEFPQE